MKSGHWISRRKFLSMAGIGTGGAIAAVAGIRASGAASSQMAATPTPFMSGGMNGMGMSAEGRKASASFMPDLEINIRAVVGEQSVFSGPKTKVWRYQGEVVKGDPNAMVNVPDSYLGPVLVLKKGQKVRVNFTNQLPEESIIHWHGLLVPSEMDGLPDQAVGPGKSYVYEFEVKNRAGLSWFHPHPDMRTGFQAYQGLAGLILVKDEEETQLGLPGAGFDVPLVIQDRVIDGQNQWVYPANMMAMMAGALGDRVLVNGRSNPVLPLAGTAYRLRLLNGSNARTYKLAWEDNTPWTVIGTDGGLLEKPVQRPYLMLAPGERLEVWADFSKYASGSQVKLVSKAFAASGMGMMGGGMMGGMTSSRPNGAEFQVMTVKIEKAGPPPAPLPKTLAKITRLVEKDAVNAANPRTFTITAAHMTWLMNGRTYQANVVAPDEVVKFNTTEAWVFKNSGMMGGMGMMGGAGMGGMMAMPHVMHLHNAQFLIIDRQVDAAYRTGWQTVNEGLVDEGWKDTFLLMPGEAVKFLVRFADYSGLYMYHCHIIEHEDMGMMRYYRIDP